MNPRMIVCALMLSGLCLSGCGGKENVYIVPQPLSVRVGNGGFTFSADTQIAASNEEDAAVARWFAGLFQTPAGFEPEVVTDERRADVVLSRVDDLPEEAYRLDVTRRSVKVEASSASGFFYGLQTLRMALPAEMSALERADAEWTVPAMRVSDAPRMGYRALMIDVARYFMPKQDLLRMIDCMAMLKLNVLHLHLTDDNGWRIEIKKYPRLTSVGAWRVDRESVPFPDRRNPLEGEPATTGGYYTQDDIREIVRYAAERNVEVIPEIEMPAHANAALAAYPEHACRIVDEYIGVLPGLGGKNAEIILCAGDDATLVFMKDIIDEVCGLFPSEYVHLGGDEAVKTNWARCPDCQKRIKDNSLADEEALQGWFMKEMNDYLKSKGKRMMAWDEVTLSDIPEGAVVFGWRGHGEAAKVAAEKGHDFVLTPARLLYLIRYQGPQWFEPLTYFGNNTLKDIYDYEPFEEEWVSRNRDKMLGLQASMWTEFCDCTDDVTYQVFPRLAAVAEVAWSAEGRGEWRDFVRAVDVFGRHLDEMGVVYARSMFNICHQAKPLGGGMVRVTLECERPDVEIRYTLDGSDPDVSSALYGDGLVFNRSLVLKASAFSSDGIKAGRTLELPVVMSRSSGRRVRGDGSSLECLVNGVDGSLRQTDMEWCLWQGESASFEIDLGGIVRINEVAIGCLTNYGMGYHKPKSVEISVSDGRGRFRKVSRMEWDPEEIFIEGNFKETLLFEFAPVQAKCVRVDVEGAGVCPSDHLRPGYMSGYCFDEVRVRSRPPGFVRRSPTVIFRKNVAGDIDSVVARKWDDGRNRWAGQSAFFEHGSQDISQKNP